MRLNDEDLVGSAEAAAILGMERSVFTRKVNATPPLVAVAMRGSGTTGEKFFHRADIVALAVSAVTPVAVQGQSDTHEERAS
jgi:hypothetical protein